MPDIIHEFPIWAAPADVFRAISEPEGLDEWWTLDSSGTPEVGQSYSLGFGPGYEWSAEVIVCEPLARFELRLTNADPDWEGTTVGFRLQPRDRSPQGAATTIRFYHRDWPEENEHYRVSCYCWAMYLRILKRFLEHGERVAYAERLNV